MRIILIITLILSATTNAVQAGRFDNKREQTEILRTKVKQWAFDQAKDALSLSHKHYKNERLLSHSTFTHDGCEAYITALENYEILDRLKNPKALMKVKFWHRYKRKTPKQLIQISKEKLNKKTNLYTWKVRVPLSIEIEKGYKKENFNFLAAFEIQQFTEGKEDFYISNWNTLFDVKRMGIRADNYDVNRYEINRKACNLNKKDLD